MTIGSKEAFKTENDPFFPSITVCPYADKQTMGPLMLVDPMSKSDNGYNFTYAIKNISVKPVVHQAATK